MRAEIIESRDAWFPLQSFDQAWKFMAVLLVVVIAVKLVVSLLVPALEQAMLPMLAGGLIGALPSLILVMPKKAKLISNDLSFAKITLTRVLRAHQYIKSSDNDFLHKYAKCMWRESKVSVHDGDGFLLIVGPKFLIPRLVKDLNSI